MAPCLFETVARYNVALFCESAWIESNSTRFTDVTEAGKTEAVETSLIAPPVKMP